MQSTKTYKVNDIFGPTIQGEGTLAGNKAMFLRMAQCNLRCDFCDTEFDSYTEMTAQEIQLKINGMCDWGYYDRKFLIITGGEPTLQVDAELWGALKQGWRICLETNGMYESNLPWYHVSVSPKTAPEHIKVKRIDDLKILWPAAAEGVTPEAYRDFRCRQKWLQVRDENYEEAVAKWLELGVEWKLGIQQHKVIGVK